MWLRAEAGVAAAGCWALRRRERSIRTTASNAIQFPMPLLATYVPKSRLNQKTKARSLNMDTSFERTTSPRTTASAPMVIAGGEEDAPLGHGPEREQPAPSLESCSTQLESAWTARRKWPRESGSGRSPARARAERPYAGERRPRATTGVSGELRCVRSRFRLVGGYRRSSRLSSTAEAVAVEPGRARFPHAVWSRSAAYEPGVPNSFRKRSKRSNRAKVRRHCGQSPACLIFAAPTIEATVAAVAAT